MSTKPVTCLDARSRMVSFRMTDDEYARCRQLCLEHGIRSVSEMARSAISHLLQEPARLPSDVLETRVSDIEARLRILVLEVKRLAAASAETDPPRYSSAFQAKELS